MQFASIWSCFKFIFDFIIYTFVSRAYFESKILNFFYKIHFSSSVENPKCCPKVLHKWNFYHKRRGHIQTFFLIMTTTDHELLNFLLIIKWGAFCRWSSSHYCPMRNSDKMTIGRKHPTLQKPNKIYLMLHIICGPHIKFEFTPCLNILMIVNLNKVWITSGFKWFGGHW